MTQKEIEQLTAATRTEDCEPDDVEPDRIVDITNTTLTHIAEMSQEPKGTKRKKTNPTRSEGSANVTKRGNLQRP